MAGREVVHGDGGALNQTQKFKIFSHDRPLDSLFASAASNSFIGSRTMFSFGAVGRANGSGNSFIQSFDQEENGEEYLGEYFNQPDKKKRLSEDQVQFLEKSFEAENKLEHERKIQLANELGLQPRNIAVWFQNRRARWKTKQLETDYETLHASYKNLETDYAYLLEENGKLKSEVLNLKHNGRSGDTVQLNSQPHDTEKPSEAMPKEAVAYMLHEGEKLEVPALDLRNEEQSSAGSDLTNAECPWSIHGIHPIVDSSHVLELDQSDLSHNGEDSLKEELLHHAYISPKIKDTYCHPHANSCSVEDHAFSFWSSY